MARPEKQRQRPSTRNAPLARATPFGARHMASQDETRPLARNTRAILGRETTPLHEKHARSVDEKHALSGQELYPPDRNAQ
eukprot:1963251-Pyramimonas_sp.AAC.1